MTNAQDIQMSSQESTQRMEEGRIYLPTDPEIWTGSLTVWKNFMIITIHGRTTRNYVPKCSKICLPK